uniref:H1.5 linker histone, cluster member n=1 Tax=Papio anubis TaxID=9555 RepID=A0A096NCV1_PAPAN
MSETAPAETATPAPVEKSPAKKKATKKAAGAGAAKRKPTGPPVSELITKAVAASKERNGLSLAALKKALAAGGYDVEKNNSRIKLGLKSLVSKGTLVQTKGTGASGSFKLNKKAASGEAKPKAKKTGAAPRPNRKRQPRVLPSLRQLSRKRQSPKPLSPKQQNLKLQRPRRRLPKRSRKLACENRNKAPKALFRATQRSLKNCCAQCVTSGRQLSKLVSNFLSDA